MGKIAPECYNGSDQIFNLLLTHLYNLRTCRLRHVHPTLTIPSVVYKHRKRHFAIACWGLRVEGANRGGGCIAESDILELYMICASTLVTGAVQAFQATRRITFMARDMPVVDLAVLLAKVTPFDIAIPVSRFTGEVTAKLDRVRFPQLLRSANLVRVRKDAVAPKARAKRS